MIRTGVFGVVDVTIGMSAAPRSSKALCPAIATPPNACRPGADAPPPDAPPDSDLDAGVFGADELAGREVAVIDSGLESEQCNVFEDGAVALGDHIYRSTPSCQRDVLRRTRAHAALSR